MNSKEYLESKSYVSGIGTVRKVTLNDALIAIEMATLEGMIVACHFQEIEVYKEKLKELKLKHNIPL